MAIFFKFELCLVISYYLKQELENHRGIYILFSDRGKPEVGPLNVEEWGPGNVGHRGPHLIKWRKLSIKVTIFIKRSFAPVKGKQLSGQLFIDGGNISDSCDEWTKSYDYNDRWMNDTNLLPSMDDINPKGIHSISSNIIP